VRFPVRGISDKEVVMQFVHSQEYLNQGDVVELMSDRSCNFLMTDDQNFALYKNGEVFGYYGGHFTSFPAQIKAPSSGKWNITIDSPDGKTDFTYSLRMIK
jgi:hypothetical protein